MLAARLDTILYGAIGVYVEVRRGSSANGKCLTRRVPYHTIFSRALYFCEIMCYNDHIIYYIQKGSYSMSEECTRDCSSCGVDCSSRRAESLLAELNPNSSVKKVYAVMSGKGGVGKSIVTSMLSVLAQRKGLRTAILDADITGPSIPTSFNIHTKAEGTDQGLEPVVTAKGIQVMSLNLLLENETDPVVWRGPVIAGAVKQFWTDVIWHDVDVMFIDMPPGTGDVPLTVFQSVPVDGIIVVTSPQELVSMIVEKAVNMADMMNIPIVGLVENMSYYECPDCGKRHSIFGESRIDKTAEQFGIPNTAKLPIDPQLAKWCDEGLIELFEGEWLDKMSEELTKNI